MKICQCIKVLLVRILVFRVQYLLELKLKLTVARAYGDKPAAIVWRKQNLCAIYEFACTQITSNWFSRKFTASEVIIVSIPYIAQLNCFIPCFPFT